MGCHVVVARITIVGVLSTCLLAAVPSILAQASSRTCNAPSGARTIRADANVILFRKTLGSDPVTKRLAYWACLRATGRKTRLTDATTPIGEPPTINSAFHGSRRFIAYLQTVTSHDRSDYFIFAYDLVTRRRATGVPGTGLPVGGATILSDGRRSSRIRKLGVSDGGGLAWRTVGPDNPATEPDLESISVFDRNGLQTLDTGKRGSIEGPVIRGRAVTWRSGGVARTYMLQTGR